MENREEETENTQRERRQSSESTSSFPLDVVSEILSKMPINSVARSRCVSKLWSSISTDPYFINTYETQTLPSLLVFFQDVKKDYVFSIPQLHQKSEESASYTGYQVTYPKHCSLFRPFSMKTESVHGLICFQNLENPMVWNPTTRKFLTFPPLEKNWDDVSVLLGYDPIEHEHKLLCMPFDKTGDECQVITLGSDQESWRTVKTNYNHYPSPYFRDHWNRRKVIYGRCINGVLYYQANLGFTRGSPRVIMRFDVRSEKLDVIETPSSTWGEFWCMKMIAYEGRLAFVGSDSMWVLEDAGKREWYKHTFIPPFRYDRSFELIGSTDDGELMYAQNIFEKSFFNIRYVDPVRNTFRILECSGRLDDLRQRNGLGDRPLLGLHFFPNHIETL